MPETLRRRVRTPVATPSHPKRINVISKAALDRQNQQPESLLAGPRGAAAGILLHLLTATVFLHIAEGWALLDALYFAVVTATTVGYGDLAPVQPVSKLFVAAYAIVSVALIAGLLQALVERVADAQRGMAEGAVTRFLAAGDGKEERVVEGDLVYRARLQERWARSRLRATIMMFAAACLSGALLYGKFLRITFVDLVYFLCVSMTTVGLGDIHPVSNLGKAYALVWLVFTSLGFAAVLNQYAELKVKLRERELAEKLLRDDIGDRMFGEIDGDGSNALSEAEFLGYMMCKLGKASPEDIRGIISRFRELDKDGSGVITKDEIISESKKNS